MALLQYFLGRLKHSFWALPLFGCCLGVALAIGAYALDANRGALAGFDLPDFARIDAESARTLLGAIAGAMATMLSLTYTLTLVVFTLAAGTLAPRLLESFSDNRANQITIAILSATFVFALLSLYLMSKSSEARFTALTAILLAMISIGALVYFVHDVANRVLVDNEIARAADRLTRAILLEFRREAPPPLADVRPYLKGGVEIRAQRSGYVQTIDEEMVLARAADQETFLDLEIKPGDFVAEGCRIARLHGGSEKHWTAAIDRALVIGPTRTSDRDVLFCVDLLVEIALRALSPGINDSFTAVRCVDQLSAALVKASGLHPRPATRCDAQKRPRMTAPTVTLEDLINAAFEPIGHNAVDNALVQNALRKAFGRMEAVAPSEHVPMIQEKAAQISCAA